MNGYDLERAMALRKRVLSELRALPGVAGAALVSRLPLAPDINMEGVRIRGHHGRRTTPTHVDAVSVGADYFQVVGVPIVEGRAITEDDVEGARRVVVINETMARRYLARAEPARRARLHGGLRGGAARGRRRRPRPQGALGGRGAAAVPAPSRSAVARRLPGRAHDHCPPRRRCRCCARRSWRSSRTSSSPRTSPPPRSSPPRWRRRGSAPPCSAPSARWRCCWPRSGSTASSPTP